MRVAYVLNTFPRMSETFILNQITGLIDRGMEVDIYARSSGSWPDAHPDIARYGLRSRVRYPVGPPTNSFVRRRRMCAAIGSMLARSGGSPSALERAVRHARTDAYRALSFFPAPEPSQVYDAIHCHFGTTGELALSLRAAGKLTGPVITTFHGYDISRIPRRDGSDIYARLFQEGDLFIPVSNYWERELIRLGCPAERILVHRMGIDCRDFEFVSKDLPRDEPLRLLTVARLVEKKGVEYAIRAVARLAETRADLDYRIVGDGPLRAHLQGVINALGMGERITLQGGQPQPVVRQLLGKSHIFLLPSVTASDGDMEGIPVSLMEALASGTPVLSSSHSGIPELVEHGVTGLLSREGDVDGISRNLRRLSRNGEMYRRMSQEGRRMVETHHNIDRLNDRLAMILSGELSPGSYAHGDPHGAPEAVATR
jgi:colanic acid/amylovoran biosynthesis glycosyltransferase